MPGMMDTILNLGLNDDVVAGMIAKNSDIKFVRFVYDSYRRFIQMFSDVVMGLAKSTFEVIIDEEMCIRDRACTVRLTANLRHRETARPDRKPERPAPPSGSYCPSGSGISDKPECIMKNTLCREALQWHSSQSGPAAAGI